MWQQTYTPVFGNLGLSALVATIPIFALVYSLGIRQMPSWKASLVGLAAAELLAVSVYRMPLALSFSAITYGAAFGVFPVGWIVFWAITLYRFTLETGSFEIIKDSIGTLTTDPRLQALLIAFSFGAFIEGACGFGTPVAVAAAMLTGLGFTPLRAAALCLVANTAPVAFGALGLPLVALGAITELPLSSLSANVGRICAPISLIIPAYLIVIMDGWRSLWAVFPAAVVAGATFAGTQFMVSNLLGPYLTDIVAALSSMLGLIALFRFWKPKQRAYSEAQDYSRALIVRHPKRKVLIAWVPYGLLILFVVVWGISAVKVGLNAVTITINWRGLHNQIQRIPPVVAYASPYGATYTFDWLADSGTACMLATLVSSLFLGMSPRRTLQLMIETGEQLLFPLMTIAAVLALAFLMNYSGATATLGLAFAATAVLFPFFSALLGWLGVFLTGSDTASNALFGKLQIVTAHRLGLSPTLMAAANSGGGVMGKMISLQSIAVAAAATQMKPADEAKLFRFTLRHSLYLGCAIGMITLLYAYCLPHWVK